MMHRSSRRIARLLATIGISLATAGCPGADEDKPAGDGEPPELAVADGSIEGRVCHSSGTTWLADALVYTHLVDTDGKLFDTRIDYTDAAGRFALDPLPGARSYVVYVQYGGETVLKKKVRVEGDEAVVLEEPRCLDPRELRLAVVTGDRGVDATLDAIGLTEVDTVDGKDPMALAAFLLDPSAMSAYDVIILDAGHAEAGILYPLDASRKDGEDGGDTGEPGDTGAAPDDTGALDDTGTTDDTGEPGIPTYDTTQIVQNLVDFVDEGGALFAIEWAYDAVEHGWPEAIEFAGEDTTPDAAQIGMVCEVEAAALDTQLEDWVGGGPLAIQYVLGEWPMIESVAGTTHLTGEVPTEAAGATTVPDTPLLVSFPSGEGMVVLSTFPLGSGATADMQAATQHMMILIQDARE